MEEKGHFVSKLFSATFHHMICWSCALKLQILIYCDLRTIFRNLPGIMPNSASRLWYPVQISTCISGNADYEQLENWFCKRESTQIRNGKLSHYTLCHVLQGALTQSLLYSLFVIGWAWLSSLGHSPGTCTQFLQTGNPGGGGGSPEIVYPC